MKTFKKDSLDAKHNLRKLLVAGVTMMALSASGVQTANAQGVLDKIFDRLEKANKELVHFNNDMDAKKREIQKTEYYIKHTDKNTGGIISSSVGLVKGLILKNKQKKVMNRQQEGTYQESAHYGQSPSAQTQVTSQGDATYQISVEELAAVQTRVAALKESKAATSPKVSTPTTKEQKQTGSGLSKEEKADQYFQKMKTQGYLR